MRASSVLGLTLLAVLVFARPGMAQVDSREGIALQNQIYQLRQEIQMMRDQGGYGGGAPRPGYQQGGGNDMVAQLLTRVDAMEDQLRQLRGRVDELHNQLQRQNADLGKRIDDLAFQLNARAPGGGSTLTAPPPQPPGGGTLQPPPVTYTPPPANEPHVRTPEIAMQEGNAALARRDYASAEAAAREVTAARTSPRAYDGQMLLAQALFGERKYSDAALAFDDTYKRNKRGAHAQDALLGLANSLVGIGEKQAACATLAKLQSEFPQPRSDLRAGIAAAGQRADCR
jgi:TolA-binding protein